MSLAPSPPRAAARRLSALLLGALLAPAAAGAAPIGEQVDRGDGIAGAAALADLRPQQSAVSEDGRYAFFSYVPVSGSKTGDVSAAALPLVGLYLRDVRDNRTVQLARTGVKTAYGIDRPYGVTSSADGAKVSFTSRARLLAADADDSNDVYVADAATGQLALVSTSSAEVRGAFLTADGASVVWNDGTLRRTPLAGGAAVTLAQDVAFLQAISADGRTAAYQPTAENGTIVFAREGRSPVVVPDSIDGASSLAFAVSPDGRTAGLATWDRRRVRGIDLETGAAATVPVQFAGYAQPLNMFGLSNDGWVQVTARSNAGTHLIGEVNLRTQATRTLIADLPWQPTGLTRNGRFATTGANHLMVVPTGATPLPGTLDPPSPMAYLSFDYGCRSTNWFFASSKAFLTVSTLDAAALPAPVSAAVTIRDRASGKVVNQFTINSPANIYPITPASGYFRADVTAKLADGRSVSGSYAQDSYARIDCPGFYL